jgi:hypothetical protein
MGEIVHGKTGEFPEGKLNKDDEGALNMKIFHFEGHVHLDFGSPVKWFALGPEQARQLAAVLTEHANQAERDYQ